MVTNGLGIVRDISFFNRDYLNTHPDIIIDKKSDSPYEDKSLHDAKAVIPVLKDFFENHPLINPYIFLGDAAFDSCIVYKSPLVEEWFTSILKKIFVLIQEPFEVLMNGKNPIKYDLL